jgi:hypothetical protein
MNHFIPYWRKARSHLQAAHSLDANRQVLMGGLTRIVVAILGSLLVLFSVFTLFRAPSLALTHPKVQIVLVLGLVGLWCILRATRLIAFRSDGRWKKGSGLADRIAKWNVAGLMVAGMLVFVANIFDIEWLGKIAVWGLVVAFLWIPVSVVFAVGSKISNNPHRGSEETK